MATVIVATYGVSSFPAGGGHFWVYMQYMHALRRAGCDVHWLEQFDPEPRYRAPADDRAVAVFFDRARAFGFEGRTLLYRPNDDGAPREWIRGTRAQAEATLRRADLLLNFHYAIHPSLLALPGRTALVDIDPGLLQVWIDTGELSVHPHDTYFTIGETVGEPAALFPDCGVRWHHIRPPVCLDLWPCSSEPAARAFTTVSGWWSGEWIRIVEDGEEVLSENTKRAGILPFAELPRHTDQPLELTLDLADSDLEARRTLEGFGWRVRSAREVAGTPYSYRSYIQGSRGEWSASKPSCTWFQNAWISDRTVCYLASGKPAVVQHTGPSSFLPDGEGVFRFTTIAEAAEALEAVNADYDRQCEAARDLAETHFDAAEIVPRILDAALP